MTASLSAKAAADTVVAACAGGDVPCHNVQPLLCFLFVTGGHGQRRLCVPMTCPTTLAYLQTICK